jgi:hypothetical protein
MAKRIKRDMAAPRDPVISRNIKSDKSLFMLEPNTAPVARKRVEAPAAAGGAGLV